MMISSERDLTEFNALPLPKLSFNQKRLCLGIVSGLAAICLANLEFGWLHFGPLDPKKMFIGSVVLVALVQHFVGPTLREVREYRDARRGT
jgi:hypothetical protein